MIERARLAIIQKYKTILQKKDLVCFELDDCKYLNTKDIIGVSEHINTSPRTTYNV